MGQIKIWSKNDNKEELIQNLERLMPCDLRNLKENRQTYTLFTNENGGVIDDLMISNKGSYFHLVVNASQKFEDFQHLKDNLSNFCNIEFEENKSLIAIQGPKSENILSDLNSKINSMKFMDVCNISFLNFDCSVSRSGYTGEDGFEISIENKNVFKLVDTLFKNSDLLPIGLGARDSLRLEAGLCLHGNDLNSEITPVEANLKWVIHKRRRDQNDIDLNFLGNKKILKQLKEGPENIRIGLLPIGKAPMRAGNYIYQDIEGKIEIGIITVNKKKSSSNYRLVEADQIIVFREYTADTDKNIASTVPENLIPKIKKSIVFRNKNFIVINKWSGIACQRGSKINISIDDLIKFLASGKDTPKLVHRLDKDTSGLLIVALNLNAARFFHKLLSTKKITKTYFAIVKNKPKKDKGIFNDRLSNTGKSLDASTKYEVIKVLKNKLYFLKLQPSSGRKHQIRMHCYLNQSPILGDKKYYQYNKDANQKNLFLHAGQLNFVDQDNQKVNINAKLPSHFEEYL
jgi:aminomethyltransferase